jgi:hypothetical protein
LATICHSRGARRAGIIALISLITLFLSGLFSSSATSSHHALQTAHGEEQDALNEAGARTKRGARLSKSHVQDILTREIYYGQFSWNDKLYDGRHTPLISKALYDQAQEAMGRRQKPKLVKHESTYGGLLMCGHCGCAITPDHKTKKSGKHYVYYRCTNGKKSCGSVVYLREEKIKAAFAEALQRIQLTPDVVELTRKALLDSAKQEQEYRDRAIKNLNEQLALLQRRIDRCYTDHLDGNIEPDEWQSRTAAWKAEQYELRQQLSAHGRADLKYIQEGVKMIEVALTGARRTEEPRNVEGMNWLAKLDEFRTWCRSQAA